MCRLKPRRKSSAWILLSLYLFLAPVIYAASGSAETNITLTSEQYQALISNLKNSEATLLKQKLTIQSLLSKLEQSQQLTGQLSDQQQIQQNLYNKALIKIDQLLQQLKACQNSLSQADLTVTQQVKTISKSQMALADALAYSKQLEKEISKLVWQRNLAILGGILIAIFK